MDISVEVVTSPAAATPDPALLALVRRGDPAAREELARRTGYAAYVFALQLTHDPEVARDVAQEGVERFFAHLDRFDAERPWEPWLYQIVRNQVRDLRRRERVRRHESLDTWLEEGRLETADPAADPAAEAASSDLQRRLWKAISLLSDAHREILVLRDYHDRSYREIAEVLAIPVGTVMSRLHAARTRLRAILVSEGVTISDEPSGGRER